MSAGSSASNPGSEELRCAIELFNAREFFACHDALEEIWAGHYGDDREFYQGLIHAAVCLFHFESGNLGGARRMYDSACGYLGSFAPAHAGVDVARLLADLKICFAELLGPRTEYPHGVQLDEALIPAIYYVDVAG